MRAEANRQPDRLPEGIRGAFGLVDEGSGRQLFYEVVLGVVQLT